MGGLDPFRFVKSWSLPDRYYRDESRNTSAVQIIERKRA